MTIKENEGHGRLDGIISKEVLENLSICRFSYPKFPMDKTTVIMGISKDENENIVKERKNDLKKITKYLLHRKVILKSLCLSFLAKLMGKIFTWCKQTR